ncbi:hypothetical protein GLYMA_03G169801v4 [Glycine max]|nr:hypothetical protein GLYMA_03G169801v4 [Glycine max]KAH1070438.1 hypothetical protein GYH30_007490 [Glycine max]
MSPKLNGQKLLVGANFASAGIGILNDTGIQFVGIIRMFQQFELFEQYQQRLSAVIGAKRAKKVVNEALVLMTLGGNDFVITPRSRQFTVPDFSRYLISQYRRILMVLLHLRWQVVDKAHTMGWAHVTPCLTCAKTGMLMHFGMLFIQANVHLSSLLMRSSREPATL